MADTDRGGSISFEEFSEVCMKRTKFSMKSSDEIPTTERIRLSQLPKSQLIAIRGHFAKYDSDRDGRLTWNEFRRMTRKSKISDAGLRKASNSIRCSRDNCLTFQQFINLFASTQELAGCFGLNFK